MSKAPSKSYADNTVRDSRITRQCFKLSNLLSGRQPTAKIKSLFKIAAVVIFLLSLLAACGGNTSSPISLATTTPTNIPGQNPTAHKSTPSATATSTNVTPNPGTSSPTSVPRGASPTPTFDPFAPNLSAIPNPAECSKDQAKGLWFCIENLTNESNQRSLTWSASSNIPGVIFNPPSGRIPPNQTIAVDIFLKTCTTNAFLYFTGPAERVSKSIACEPTPQSIPELSVDPPSLDQSSCTSQSNGSYQCTVTLFAGKDGVNWTASSDIGATFNPSSDTANNSSDETVTITTSCKSGTFSFKGPGNTATTSWSCTPPSTPKLSVKPTSLDQSSCTSQSNSSYQCTVTLSVDQGSAKWTASSDVGATFNPSSDTVNSNGETVTITTSCNSGTFSFKGPGNTATASWSCS